jgi:transposase
VNRFIDEADRSQGTLLPETIDEYVSEENPVRVIDAFVSALDLASLGFDRVEAKMTGRPWLSPGHDAEDLPLRVSEPHSILAPT